jgi:DNA gyrase subunit A
MVTRQGVIKKTALSKYANINKNGLIAARLREDDSIVSVKLTSAGQEVIVVSAEGKAIRFNSDDARDMGRTASGVRAMRLDDGDVVVGMEPVDPDKEILVISENGYGKRTKADDYRSQNRGGKGLITYKVSDKTGRLIGTVPVTDEDDLLIITGQGVIIRVSASEIPTLSRATSGVRLMKAKNATIVDFALTDKEEPEEEGAEENADAAPVNDQAAEADTEAGPEAAEEAGGKDTEDGNEV